MIGPETFDYTRKNFWGGPWYPYWTLVTFTVLGGLFGLDHFWLRSPTTGALKLILNIFTLGLWWVYDMLQVFGEKDSVMEHGLSAPFIGPLGIGAGMFVDNQPGATTGRSPLRWMAYLLLMLTPFGLDYLVAGDSNGAFAKLSSIIFPLMWPISFVWFFVTLYYTIVTPKTLFTEGTLRFFPFSLFLDPKGPCVLGPDDVPNRPDGCDPGGSRGFFRGIFDAVLGFFNVVLPPIVMTAINSAFPGLIPAVQASSAAVTAGATTVKTGFNVATGVVEAVRDPLTVTAATASQLVQSVPGAVESAGAIAGQVTGGLDKMASPAALASLATTAAVKQAGGALLSGGDSNSDFTNSAILALLLLVLAGGSWFAAKRLNLAELVIPKRKDDGQQRDDAPPRPRQV